METIRNIERLKKDAVMVGSVFFMYEDANGIWLFRILHGRVAGKNVSCQMVGADYIGSQVLDRVSCVSHRLWKGDKNFVVV